jgi:poly-gamma-glutamate synthesis protein (capsule biosynthesis protein)
MAGDITMGNLESPLSALNTTACEKKYCFRASPDAADGLVYAGFDIMTVANNHALDYGPEVMNDTLNYLSAAGVLYTGAHLHREDRIQSPVIINKQGTDIAYLGFNDIGNSTTTNGYPRPWVASENAVKLAVEQARNEADIVVVVFHFGNEYSFSHSKRQEQLAHAAADAGADIIVGHHPHVIQEVEVYNRSIIAYSLGNFVFDQSGRAGVKEGNIFTVEVDPATKKIRGYSLDTVTINSKFQPRVSTTADFVQTITPTS